MSFKQIYEFFNLCLNKSFLRKRTRHAENDIFLMQNELKKLQEWKIDIEKRTDTRFADIWTKLDSVDVRNDKQLKAAMDALDSQKG